MAFARRCLAVLIAAAVALAPVGGAMAATHASSGMSAMAHQAHQAPTVQHDHMHDDHGAMHQANATAHAAAPKADKPCAHKTGRDCCCDDKGTCAQTCLQKCFGQMAVIPPDRAAPLPTPVRFGARLSERPPDWSPAPQLPPPRA